jgi:hypothetical protein
MNDIKRLKQLSGLETADELMSDDEVSDLESREYDNKNRLEKIVGTTILQTFKKIGFSVLEAEYGGVEHDNWSYDVSFDADSGEGIVTVDDCTAKQVAVLQTSGLADDYKLIAGRDGIRIEFVVSPNLVNTLKNQV